MNFDQKAMMFVAASANDIRAGSEKYAYGLPSPCMSVCQMDARTGLCQGCWRTLDEIAAWGMADEAYKRQVWAEIELRVAKLQPIWPEDSLGKTSGGS